MAGGPGAERPAWPPLSSAAATLTWCQVGLPGLWDWRGDFAPDDIGGQVAIGRDSALAQHNNVHGAGVKQRRCLHPGGKTCRPRGAGEPPWKVAGVEHVAWIASSDLVAGYEQ